MANPPAISHRPSKWHRPVWWLNVLAAILLLITFSAPHVPPEAAWGLALLAMTFPLQVLVHFFFLVYWLFFRRRRMLLSLVLLAIGWNHVQDHFQLFGRDAPRTEVAGTPFKFMTYNVRLFDLYNWSGNKITRDSIFQVFDKERPDILCLQEFFHSPDTRFFRTKDALRSQLGYRTHHDRYTHIGRYQTHFGIATFSRHPIIDTGSVSFEGNPNNQCIWSDILVRGDTVRVYNAHLASYHFGDEDYRFLEALDANVPGDSIRTGGARILKRLRKGIKIRALEVAAIADHIAHSPYPVIYAGDMNDVPMSFSYHRLRAYLEDAFVQSGRGHGGTYIGRLPPLRIDHIMHSPTLESWDFQTLSEELSDHRALTCSLAVQ